MCFWKGETAVWLLVLIQRVQVVDTMAGVCPYLSKARQLPISLSAHILGVTGQPAINPRYAKKTHTLQQETDSKLDQGHDILLHFADFTTSD